MKIIEIKSTETVEGDAIAKVEQYEGDISEHNMMTVPNFESLPFPTDQAFLMKSDKKGAGVILGIPLETSVKPGEVRIPWYGANKTLLGYLKVDNSGKFELENNGEELATIISDLIQTLINWKNITGIGLQPPSPATIAELTAEQQRLNTFKG